MILHKHVSRLDILFKCVELFSCRFTAFCMLTVHLPRILMILFILYSIFLEHCFLGTKEYVADTQPKLVTKLGKFPVEMK